MKIRLFISFSLVVLFNIACSTNGLTSSTASYSTWYGGQEGVSGMKYSFVVAKVGAFNLDSLSIDGRMYKGFNSHIIEDTLFVGISAVNPMILDGVAKEKSLEKPDASKLYFSSKSGKKKILEVNNFVKSKTKMYE